MPKLINKGQRREN